MTKNITVATSNFESARSVSSLPDGHRARGLHGHSFRASVYADLPSGWAAYPGGEVSALRLKLGECVEKLDYKCLNSVIEQPTDENLARWIRNSVGVPGIQRIAVQSTSDQGVDLDQSGMAHVWRRFQFQSAHQLPHVPAGHKCGRMHGHGFEVIVHANQDIGNQPISIDYDHIARIWSPLQTRLDYRCLNDIEGLENPTSENISAWLWAQLKPEIPQLSWITVFETASCGANFDGQQYRIWKDFTLDSAVQINRAPREFPEARLHGHTYKLRLHLSASLDQVMGWTIDFGDVKAIFDPIFRRLDHHPFYEIDGVGDSDTASVADWILDSVKGLPELVCVELYETLGCGSVITKSTNNPILPV